MKYPFASSFHQNPHKIFLLDCIGATVTTGLLIVILIPFQEMFGMPIFILKALAGIAALFIIYSGVCFIIKPISWSTFLRVIMIANILYGLFTLAMVAYYFADLTRLGVIYFLLENVVIVGVVWLENQVIASQKL